MQTPGDGPVTGQAPAPPTEEQPARLTRRGLMRATAGVGAATVAAGFLASALAEPAAAATTQTTPNGTGAAPADPVVAHVHDAHTGQVDLFVGTRHIRVTDRELATRLINAAR